MSANVLHFSKPTAGGSRKLKRAPKAKAPADETYSVREYLALDSTDMALHVRGEANAAGIKDGDLVLVNRSMKPRPTDYVVVEEDGEYFIRKAPAASHLRLVGAEAQGDAEFVGVITFNCSALRGSKFSRQRGGAE